MRYITVGPIVNILILDSSSARLGVVSRTIMVVRRRLSSVELL